jgi:putative Mg2+ transporter-C (MgtC) family protein
MESVSLDSILDSFLKLFLATLCGGVIGFERKTAGKPAGLRTNMLICVGSALVMILSINLSISVFESQAKIYGSELRVIGDPARLAAQVVALWNDRSPKNKMDTRSKGYLPRYLGDTK